jgi:hypothetical protein
VITSARVPLAQERRALALAVRTILFPWRIRRTSFRGA